MSRDISNLEDVIDVRDVIERFEELEGMRKPFVAGWNMPGYMPDSEPCAFETWDDARDHLVDELSREIDHLVDLEAPTGDHDAALERLNALADGGEFGETVGQYHYWISAVEGDDAFEDASDAEDYRILKALLEDLAGYGGDEEWRGDWYPITLIRDSHFETYAQELAEEIGVINQAVRWPYTCIDWEQAARELQQDYSTVEYSGVTYWYR
jgi:antirestriction protein